MFHTFIEQVDSYLSKPPSATTQHDVNQAFLSACRSVLLGDEDAVTRRVKLVVATQPAVDTSASTSQQHHHQHHQTTRPVGWRCLGMTYTVPWPLHLIITDRALEEYNRLCTH